MRHHAIHHQRALMIRRVSVFKILFCWQLVLADTSPKHSIPRSFKSPPAKVTAVDPPPGSAAAWHTKHFFLVSDTEINRESVQRFATTIESVPRLIEILPLDLSAPVEKDRLTIRLCGDETRFTELGGTEGSAGNYVSRKKEVLIRADLFLNPQLGGNSKLAEPPDENILVHEISHLVMADFLLWANPWLFEGLAEYLVIAHQGNGYYRFDQSPRLIRSHFMRQLALIDTSNLVLPPLDETLGLSFKDWSDRVGDSEPEDRYLPYASSLLFIHYHLEGGAERRRALANYVDALRAYRHRKNSKPPRFPAGDLNEVQSRLVKFWASKGMKLRFGDQ